MASATGGRVKVVYDGDCAFCRRCAAVLRRWDRARRLDLVPAKQALAAGLHPQLTPERCQQAVQVILPNGQLRSGWDGLMAALMQVPPLRWLGWLGMSSLMRPLGQRLYRFVAARRCRLGCRW